jgi:hypothetical protein
MESRKQPSLEEVKQLFTTWRASRKHKTRIPDDLWEAAASLAAQYSIHQISRALRLNHTALKDQVAARSQENNIATLQQPCFLELPPPQSPPLSECLIEMENRHGEKMRMHFAGEVSLDLLAVSQNFWTRRL